MKYNYNFGALSEGVLSFAPKPVTLDGKKFWTNSEAIHRLAGYLPIIRADIPVRESFYYTERFASEGEPAAIVQHWDEHEVPAGPEA